MIAIFCDIFPDLWDDTISRGSLIDNREFEVYTFGIVTIILPGLSNDYRVVFRDTVNARKKENNKSNKNNYWNCDYKHQIKCGDINANHAFIIKQT